MRGNFTYKAIPIIVLAIATVMLAGGCRKRVIEMPQDPGKVRFSIASATISAQEVGTRAKTDENNDFTLESQIGIYATKSDEVDVRLALPQNANVGYFNPTGSTQWTNIETNKAILFFKNDQAMNFFAYHPYTGQPGATVVMDADVVSPTLKYTLPLDQSDLKTLTSADLMWGKKLGVTEAAGVVKLEFEHKLSKISFKITAGNDWAAENIAIRRIELVGSEMPSTAAMNISTGNLTFGNEANTSIYCNYNPALSIDMLNAQECQFIAIPAQFTNIELKVTVSGSVSGEKVYSTTLAAVELRSGHLRQLTMTIYKSSSLVIQVSPQIIPWNVISDISMDAI